LTAGSLNLILCPSGVESLFGRCPYFSAENEDKSHMGRIERSREIARRRVRRAKLKKLRAKYAEATTATDKAAIVEKARKISPFAVLEG